MHSRFNTRLLEVIGVTLSLVVVSSRSAHAYIDPGTGSYVLQAAVAGILAAAFVIRSTWSNIKRAFGRVFLKRAEDDK